MSCINIFFIIILISSAYCYRSFHYPLMCNNEAVTDCSFQIPSSSNSCWIYNTEVCKKPINKLFPNLQPLSELESETKSHFDVSIVPYSFMGTLLEDNLVSAINITFVAKHKEIKGFSMNMSQDVPATFICRIIDFTYSSVNLQYPVTFFYDCFHNLVEKMMKNVMFTFTVYPLNIRLKYFVYVPPIQNQFHSACSWSSLIMILQGSLKKNFVELKFSRASTNTTYYKITLLDPVGVVKDRVKVLDTPRTNMISGQFFDVRSGFYSVAISILTAEGTSCEVGRTDLFHVGTEIESGVKLISLWIILSILVLLSCVLPFLHCLYQNHHNTGKKLKLLLIYSCYSLQHEEDVFSFKQCLEEEFQCLVSTIYKTGQDAYSFLLQRYVEADILIFVVSEGVHHMIDKQNSPPLLQHHPCKNQLLKAYELYFSKFHKLSKKKACAVCFPYSGKHHLPKLLKPVKFFRLPKDRLRFVCYVFGCKKTCLALNNLQHDKDFKGWTSSIRFENKGDESEIGSSGLFSNELGLSPEDLKVSKDLGNNVDGLAPLMEKYLFEHEHTQA